MGLFKKMKDPVRGSAEVVLVEGGVTGYGTAMWVPGSMELLVTVEGIPATKVHWSGPIRCARRPWEGDSIPVTVDRANPQKVSIEWSEMKELGREHEEKTREGAWAAREQRDQIDHDSDQDMEEARQMWRDNLAKGYCTQEEFDEQMRILDEA